MDLSSASGGLASVLVRRHLVSVVALSSALTSGVALAQANPFDFNDNNEATINALTTSNVVTLTGISGCEPVSVSGTGGGSAHQFAIAGGIGWTNAADQCVNNGDVVAVRHLSSPTPLDITTTELCVGAGPTVCGDFSSVTVAADDAMPAPFDFGSKTGVALSTLVSSANFFINGFAVPVTASIDIGDFRVAGGPWNGPGAMGVMVSPGQAVQVRHTSSAMNNGTVTSTVTIGGVTGTFESTTFMAGDTTPDAFSFSPKGGDNPLTDSVVESRGRTLSGFQGGQLATATGGDFSVNGGAFSSGALVNPGDTIVLRQTSALTQLTSKATTLTIGGVSGSMTTMTLDETPTNSAFSPKGGQNQQVNTVVESRGRPLSGFNQAKAVVVGSNGSNHQFSITRGGVVGPWISEGASAVVLPGDTVKVRHTTPGATGQVTVTTLRMGGPVNFTEFKMTTVTQ